MQPKSFLLFIGFLIVFCSFDNSDDKLPVYINGYQMEVTEGMYVNCRKIQDLSVIMPITDQMKQYDIFKIELHRFGKDIDIIAASRAFDPKSKEFIKKQSKLPSIKLKVLEAEGEFSGSDLNPNTMLFAGHNSVNSVFCDSHDLKQCSFYLVVRGYNKIGEKTQFGEDIFDKGADLTAKSVVFKSWLDRTVR
jgi:hypothetical protein